MTDHDYHDPLLSVEIIVDLAKEGIESGEDTVDEALEYVQKAMSDLVAALEARITDSSTERLLFKRMEERLKYWDKTSKPIRRDHAAAALRYYMSDECARTAWYD